METYYVRAKGGSAWHWQHDCSRYPRTFNIETSRRDRPAENLCDECRSREYLRSLGAGHAPTELRER